MVRTCVLAILVAAGLAGCATDGYRYRGVGGDYYYGQPSVDYYYDDRYGGYGYPGWYGGYGYRGYYGYGYPYYGWNGGYWDYPYYWPPYYPRPPHHPRPDDDDGPKTGGNLPPSRADGGARDAEQVPRAIARPRLSEGVDGPVRRDWRNPPSGLRRDVPRVGGSGAPVRVRPPASIVPAVPRSAPPSRVDSRPPRMERSMPREHVSRPSAPRERDTGQERDR